MANRNAPPPPKNEHVYRVTVDTGDEVAAGTETRVYLTLYGSRGATAEIRLNNPNVSDFDPGSKSVFTFEAQWVGDLERVRLRHDNSGYRPGWFVESVVVEDLDTHKRWIVPFNRWLATDRGDGKIDVIMGVLPGPKPARASGGEPDRNQETVYFAEACLYIKNSSTGRPIAGHAGGPGNALQCVGSGGHSEGKMGAAFKVGEPINILLSFENLRPGTHTVRTSANGRVYDTKSFESRTPTWRFCFPTKAAQKGWWRLRVEVDGTFHSEVHYQVTETGRPSGEG